MKVIVPDIGDFKDVAVIEVLVSPGDSVEAETPLITIESDKATMDVPAPAAGRISAVRVKAGDKVSEGSHIADIEEPAPASASEAPAKAADPPAASAPKDSAKSAKTETKAAAGAREVRVPDIGDFKDVPVIEVLVSPGDSVTAEAPLITLESDKATLDVPAPFSGVIKKIEVAAGDKVSEGFLIALVAPEKGEREAAAAPASKPVSESADAPPPAAPHPGGPRGGDAPKARPGAAAMPPVVESEKSFGKPHASPSVRKFARELGADLQKIKGSGLRGRVLKEDVQEYVKSALRDESGGARGPAPLPPVDFSQFGEIELHPLPRIRKLSAGNLQRNWALAPHVTQCAEADITDMEEFRKSLAEEAKKQNYRMTPLAFFVRAAVMSLREFPSFNASLHEDGEHLVRKNYFNIGVAVDTPNGLVVPVLKDAERKGLSDIARELGELSARAREGNLKADDMRGGCFTISSLGGIGGSFFTPIINLPEAAIMGISRSQIRPRWNGEEFEPRLILPLSLSYDHRIIDGAEGARFITHYASLLADIRRLSL